MNNQQCNTRKIPNSATSATSSSIPNTIVLRDSDSSTRLSSIILKGADFIKSSVAAELLTKGFIYFKNHHANHQYALMRNLEEGECALNLSLDFGQNNLDGNFNIRTEQVTNLSVRNNKIGINTSDPQSTLDVNGSVRVRNLTHVGPVYSNEFGELYTSSDPYTSSTPYHVTDSSQEILFNNSIIIIEVDVEINLPTNKYDGYSVTFVNKFDGPIYIRSTEKMFHNFYLPMGGVFFVCICTRIISISVL